MSPDAAGSQHEATAADTGTSLSGSYSIWAAEGLLPLIARQDLGHSTDSWALMGFPSSLGTSPVAFTYSDSSETDVWLSTSKGTSFLSITSSHSILSRPSLQASSLIWSILKAP